MSALMTTITVSVLAERLVKAELPTAGHASLLEEIQRTEERLVEVMHEKHVNWDRERLSIVQAAILRDWYWYPIEGG